PSVRVTSDILIYERIDQTRDTTRRLPPGAAVRLAWQSFRLAISNGIISVLIAAKDTTPEDVYITEFCGYKPLPAHTPVRKRWHDLVAGRCRGALERYHPVLKQRSSLGEVFHY